MFSLNFRKLIKCYRIGWKKHLHSNFRFVFTRRQKQIIICKSETGFHQNIELEVIFTKIQKRGKKKTKMKTKSKNKVKKE